jgi:hypothetical protein
VDETIKPPTCELFEVKTGIIMEITLKGTKTIIRRRKKLKRDRINHRCAIVVSPDDSQIWNLAKFYESMSLLHEPAFVLVFGDMEIAKKWLGIKVSELNRFHFAPVFSLF